MRLDYREASVCIPFFAWLDASGSIRDYEGMGTLGFKVSEVPCRSATNGWNAVYPNCIDYEKQGAPFLSKFFPFLKKLT
jgi:hypothetical protein